MAAIPLVIITLDLDVIPLVVSTIMKGKPFQFSVSGKICMMRAVIFVFLLQRIGLQTYSPSVDLSHARFLTPGLAYSQKLMRPESHEFA